MHVGDTISWTNIGPSSHTATATDGSFDTGILSKGNSASHGFARPGTFTYFCKIHPFMHGTIVVIAAPAAPSPPSHGTRAPAGSSPATSGAAAATPVAGQPVLPKTGVDLAGMLLAGFVVGGIGYALRRASPRAGRQTDR